MKTVKIINQFMKKILQSAFVFVLSLMIALGSMLPVFASDTNVSNNTGDLSNFKTTRTYGYSQFQDVSSNDWFFNDVKAAYEYGLINGKSVISFDPKGSLTLAEAITMAVNIHVIYMGNTAKIENVGKNWYDGAVNYAIENHIIKSGEFTDLTSKATRAQMAYIFSRILKEEDLARINQIDKLPDVDSTTSNVESIFKLYNAGVISGLDLYGTFNPYANVTRAETVSIVKRIVLNNERKVFTLQAKPVEKIATVDDHKGGLNVILFVDYAHEALFEGNLITAELELWDENKNFITKTSLSGAKKMHGGLFLYFPKTIKEGEKYYIMLREKSPILNSFVSYDVDSSSAIEKNQYAPVTIMRGINEDTNKEYLIGSLELPFYIFTSVGNREKAVIIVHGESSNTKPIGDVPLVILNHKTKEVTYGTSDSKGIFILDLNTNDDNYYSVELDTSKSQGKTIKPAYITLPKNEHSFSWYEMNIDMDSPHTP